MAAWADWEAQFFDLESALVRRAAVPGEAMAKARKKRISQVPKTVSLGQDLESLGQDFTGLA